MGEVVKRTVLFLYFSLKIRGGKFECKRFKCVHFTLKMKLVDLDLGGTR